VSADLASPPHAPAPFERLLLRAALAQGDDCFQAWTLASEIAGHANTLDQASHRLMPLLYRNLEAHGVDDPRMGLLRGIYRYAWFQNQQRFSVAGEMIDRLQSAGIETIVLKGAALSALYYRDLGVRPVWDVDVLVRRADAPRAAEVLHAAGWTAPAGDGRSLEYMLRFRHAKLYECPRGGGIDLHWFPMSEPVPMDDLWGATVPVAVGGVETRALSPTDELLVACAHGLGRSGAPVRWISDATTVIRTAEIDWAQLVDRAERWRVSARLELALRVLRDEFGAGVPDHVLGDLARASRPCHERVTHRALLHRPRRGITTIVEWDRYRRLRALGAHTGRFPGYLRELTESRTWPLFLVRYSRRGQRLWRSTT
jgi:hypothetical protein